MPVARRGARRLCVIGRTWIEPGMRVVHPGQPDWGTGQVQSVVGDRVTVNFEHRGKVLVNAAVVDLRPADEDA
jgi:FKBP-type peptidyl-prolyl cis-trans isomerase 2